MDDVIIFIAIVTVFAVATVGDPDLVDVVVRIFEREGWP